MIRNLVYLTIGSILLTGCIAVHGNGDVEKCELVRRPVHVLRHVVLLKFKDGATPAEIREVESAFAALPGKVDAIYDLEWGTDVSVENLQDGFTHCFIVSFLSEADRAKYLPHPAHKEFGRILGPKLDKALVVDFWAKD